MLKPIVVGRPLVNSLMGSKPIRLNTDQLGINKEKPPETFRVVDQEFPSSTPIECNITLDEDGVLYGTACAKSRPEWQSMTERNQANKKSA